MSIREQQASALKTMLNFNSTAENKELTWKVLIFDKHGRDIISSVLRVNDLFKAGVTLHLLLGAERYPLPDVPAIYFVDPTPENITRIAKDVNSNLYQSWSINFTSPLPRKQLEDFAQNTLATSQRINQIYDQFLDFVVLENNIFSLEMPRVYHDFAEPKVTEQQIEQIVDQVVNGLFCVLITERKLPIIRATRGNAAEMIAQRLDEKLRSHVQNSRNAITLDATNRPVLVLLDRNIDLVSMFSHSWTYQSLVNDACVLNRARVTVKGETGATTSYDIEPSDTFWQTNKTLPFPDVADNLDAALTKYKHDAQKLTGTTDIDTLEPSTAHLKTALTSLPELTARKQTIDMHMNIATVLLSAIGKRGLAQLFEAEQTATKQSMASILELINDKELAEPKDKLRLYLVYFLSTPISPADQQEFEAALKEQGCDLAALEHIKHAKEISKMTLVTAQTQQQPAPASHQGALFQKVSGLTSNFTSHINQGTLSGGFGSLISGVKGFLPESKTNLPLTNVVESIMDPNSTDITSDYLCFDPKGSRGALTRPQKRAACDEAIVFLVGGGNYFEYANVMSWAEKSNKKVTYGSTDMPSPETFVATCASLNN